MKMKHLLAMGLAGVLLVGTAAMSSAAELDLAWYAAKNPDVVAAFGNTPEMLKLHYEMFGRKEARMANTHDTEAQLRRLFDPKEYAVLYPDVKAAFGENTEAMFQHYIAYGLLESRRPSEKVSKEMASTLKKTVEKAMASAGLAATPGSAQLVAAITGEIKTDVVGGVAVQQTMTQIASVVEKAVTETVKEVNNPTPVSSQSGGGGETNSSVNSTVNPPTYQVTEGFAEIGNLNDLKSAIYDPAVSTIQLTDNIIGNGSEFVTVSGKVTFDFAQHSVSGVTFHLIGPSGIEVTMKNGTINGKVVVNAGKLVIENNMKIIDNSNIPLMIGDDTEKDTMMDLINVEIKDGAEIKGQNTAIQVTSHIINRDIKVTIGALTSLNDKLITVKKKENTTGVTLKIGGNTIELSDANANVSGGVEEGYKMFFGDSVSGTSPYKLEIKQQQSQSPEQPEGESQ